MNCATISRRTFFNHQAIFLHTAVTRVWTEQQSSMLTQLQLEDEPLILRGDGRSDSPGFSAKYAFMDISHNVVLNMELVQVHA